MAFIKRKKTNQKKQMPLKKEKSSYFVHPTAMIEKDVLIGNGTKIWHFTQVRQGAKIGKHCIIGNSVFIDSDSVIGDNVKIQNHALIYHPAIIEDGVFIGPNVCFTNDKIPRAINPNGNLKLADDWEATTIKLKKGASIGAHSVILPGVSIGQFAMAGSGSVITKNVLDFALVFGNPARIRGFVCQCGRRIEVFKKKADHVLGKCRCGLEIKISKEDYKLLGSDSNKKHIWLR